MPKRHCTNPRRIGQSGVAEGRTNRGIDDGRVRHAGSALRQDARSPDGPRWRPADAAPRRPRPAGVRGRAAFREPDRRGAGGRCRALPLPPGRHGAERGGAARLCRPLGRRRGRPGLAPARAGRPGPRGRHLPAAIRPLRHAVPRPRLHRLRAHVLSAVRRRPHGGLHPRAAPLSGSADRHATDWHLDAWQRATGAEQSA